LAFATVIVILIIVSVAHAQETLKPVDSLTVIDSNGKKVGNVLSLGGHNNQPVVGFKLNNLLFLLNVAQNRLFGTGPYQGGDTLFFESSDCTGMPYLIVLPPVIPILLEYYRSPVPVVAVNVPGNTLYVPDENIPVARTMKSALDPFTPQGVCSTVNNQIPSVQAIPTIDLATMFTPPFKIQAGSKDNDNGKDKGSRNHLDHCK